MSPAAGPPPDPPDSDAAQGAGESARLHHDEASAAPHTVDEPTPEALLELAASCTDYVLAAVGVRPDYTPETLPLVDHYLIAARGDIEAQPALLPLIARAAGAYFGEVLRRQVGAFWVAASEDDHRWYVCGRRAFFALNPVGAVHAALAGSADHPGPTSELVLSPDEREAVHQRLAQAPPLPEDELFLLSSRLEALEIVCELLQAPLDDPAGSLYEEEDYEELLPQ